jgi:hypothetical protein
MTERKEPFSDEEFVKRVSELLDEIGPENAGELDETLRALGLDPDEIGARGQQAAENAMSKSLHNWRQRAPRELEEARRRLSVTGQRGTLDRAHTTAAILELAGRLGQAGQHATAHHRNLDAASDQDLDDLLAELQHLANSHPARPSRDAD